MPSLPPPPRLQELTSAHRIALFLDCDGTLIELAPGPDEVHLPDYLPDGLAVLSQALEGRLAIVSGRSVEWLHEAGLGAHVLSGTHGTELWWPGIGFDRAARPAGLDEVEAAFHAFAAERPGVIVERKALAAGLHFRKVPEHGDGALALAGKLARRTGLELQPGKMMVELRAPGGSKGTAASALMARHPFTGAMPVFVGDDITDEEGFVAAARAGGFGIAVGERDSAAASYHLPDVAAVHRWLML